MSPQASGGFAKPASEPSSASVEVHSRNQVGALKLGAQMAGYEIDTTPKLLLACLNSGTRA